MCHNTVKAFRSESNAFLSVLVALLKQALFNHMLSREAEEETEENKQSGASGCQLSASLPASPEGPPAACDGSRASPSSQKLQLPSGHSGLSETPERNGEGIKSVH